MFAPPRPVTTPPPRATATTPPVRRPTNPPPVATQSGAQDSETELSLRRQLSRLQHQLADAQRELANKDEEVAAAVEKRVELQAAHDVLLEEHRQTKLLVDEAIADRARTGGIEQRLQEAVAAADELRHQLERERSERATMALQFDEANASFDKARNLWRDEAATIDEQHIAQIAQLEQQKKAAVEAAESAMKTATERQYQAHEAELEALRAAHDRALAALRGELEPKVVAARNLSAEIERLSSELQAHDAEHQNLMAERIDLHKWEQQQAAEAHAAEIATLTRSHAVEIARLNEELNAATQAGQLIERNSALREQLWEQTVQSLRDSQKKLQQELADARERAAQAEASKWSVESRLVGTLQALEKSGDEARVLREQLETEQAESRRNVLDRERFAAYLQEGLAMLGASEPLPEHDRELDRQHERGRQPYRERAEDDDEPDLDLADLGDDPATHIHDPADIEPETQRPTRSYAVEPGLEAQLQATAADDSPSVEPDIEADPLPEPTRP